MNIDRYIYMNSYMYMYVYIYIFIYIYIRTRTYIHVSVCSQPFLFSLFKKKLHFSYMLFWETALWWSFCSVRGCSFDSFCGALRCVCVRACVCVCVYVVVPIRTLQTAQATALVALAIATILMMCSFTVKSDTSGLVYDRTPWKVFRTKNFTLFQMFQQIQQVSHRWFFRLCFFQYSENWQKQVFL